MLQSYSKDAGSKKKVAKRIDAKKVLEKEFTISEAFVKSSKQIAEKMKSGKMKTYTEAEMNKMMDEWSK